MYTRCPECNTVFRIAREQLDAADGEVRCGRCNLIFNALDALSQAVPERAARADGARPPDGGDPSVTDKPDATLLADGHVADDEDDALLEFSLPEDRWGEVFLDHELDEEQAGRDAAPGGFDDVTDPGDHAYGDGEPPLLMREDVAIPETGTAATDFGEGEPWAGGRDEAGDGRAPYGAGEEAPDPGWPQGSTDEPVFGRLAREAQAARRSGRPFWMVACLVLLIALAAQIGHLNRVALSGLPWLGDFIERAYDRTGIGLDRQTRVTDYRIVTAAASMESGNDGLLRVRATVANAAGHAQRYPLIRLTLKDRWGESVGEQLIEPGEYAAGDVEPRELLAPGEKADADIRIVDPGADAFGFELDICLRDAQGKLACAANSATR